MGGSNSIYVGCYLKLNPETKPVTETFRVKPNGKRANTRFNPETGAEYESRSETKMETIEPRPYITDRDDLYEAEFWKPAYMPESKQVVFLPNTVDEFVGIDFNNLFELSLENLDIEKRIIEFSRAKKPYLDYYKEKFGKVEVCYGIIQYYN